MLLSTTENSQCPLCSAVSNDFASDKRRDYFRCTRCSLVFADQKSWPTPEQERSEYELHKNNAFEPGYRKFLSRVAEPLKDRISLDAKGLDFGCGPGPTLSLMMAEAGWPMALYDPFFHPDQSALEKTYDFITATEVIEHIHQPDVWLPKLWGMIRPDGTLVFMTKMVIDQEAFCRWHYKNDPTHVCFYSIETFQYLAEQWQAVLSFEARDVIFFYKSIH
ncbi:class I SAM-dependent methyltransferase [Endozoicomonas sp. 8E]|uniref:class I SAM-dependent methyltransferase n=1 Tax=Endozoicomonas sp. 8E TaxID=3035692 RepID=UPI00293938E0|nr:class I SAM-dependent methyltransferase [Endozoicomonas sp. 8E]WOG25400.1 class I SAM-dependent methyltransferase [Endozoicomonas sp. 8E]